LPGQRGVRDERTIVRRAIPDRALATPCARSAGPHARLSRPVRSAHSSPQVRSARSSPWGRSFRQAVRQTPGGFIRLAARHGACRSCGVGHSRPECGTALITERKGRI
jgi:hypothetical protein